MNFVTPLPDHSEQWSVTRETTVGQVCRTGQNSRRNSVNPRNGGRYGSRRTLSECVSEFETANGLKVCSGLSLLTKATSGPLKTNRLPTILSGDFSERTCLANFSRQTSDRLSPLTASVFATWPVEESSV